jgi:hypothetical protein
LGWSDSKTEADGDGNAHARSKHAPSHVANATGTPNHLIPQQTRPSAPADGPFPCLEGGSAAGKPSGADSPCFQAVRPEVLPEVPIGLVRNLWRDWRCKWLRRFMKAKPSSG